MNTNIVPQDYNSLTQSQRRTLRLQYIEAQGGLCYWCQEPLSGPPSKEIQALKVNWKLFPQGFLRHPIHLQHDHHTGMTEGAVHALCNACMWQYHGR